MAKSLHPLQSPGPLPLDAAGEYYLDGEMRQIDVTIGKATALQTFTVDQVIGRVSCPELLEVREPADRQKDQIALVILSSFVLDDAWLEELLPPAEEVPRVVVRPHPRDQHPAWNGKVQAQDNGEVRCYPKMVGEWG